ncbi:MAG: hypothetical protein ABW110_10070 [Steroidobacteraceae bacterium]
MDAARAQTLLILLADGVHPLTGEVFPADSPYQNAEIVRALYFGIRCLEAANRAVAAQDVLDARDSRRQSATPTASSALLKGNAGKPWSADEERELLERFDAGVLPGELAKQHGRSVAGIEARLEKLGRLRPDQRTTTSRYPLSMQGSRTVPGE